MVKSVFRTSLFNWTGSSSMALPSAATSTALGWFSRKESASSASFRDLTVTTSSPLVSVPLRPSRAAKGFSFSGSGGVGMMRAVSLAKRKTAKTKRTGHESYEPSYKYLPQSRPYQRYRQFMHSTDGITTSALSVGILMTYACPITALWLSRVVSDRPQAAPTGWYRLADDTQNGRSSALRVYGTNQTTITGRKIHGSELPVPSIFQTAKYFLQAAVQDRLSSIVVSTYRAGVLVRRSTQCDKNRTQNRTQNQKNLIFLSDF